MTNLSDGQRIERKGAMMARYTQAKFPCYCGQDGTIVNQSPHGMARRWVIVEHTDGTTHTNFIHSPLGHRCGSDDN